MFTGALVGGAALVTFLAAPASAASGTWSSSGVTGVHAQGSWKTEFSKIYFEGYVRDTSCDGHGVYLNIAFMRSDVPGLPAGTYRRETVTNTGGCNTNKSFSFNSYQPGRKISIAVQECVKDAGFLGSDKCSSFNTVVTTNV